MDCPEGAKALLSTGFWLNYTVSYYSASNEYNKYHGDYWINYNQTLPIFTYSHPNHQSVNITQILYTAVQPEHGGGNCHCIDLDFKNTCLLQLSKQSTVATIVR